ncbi:MAG: ABC transporter ATP-binding protein [Candidatus Komeilibacteria bacterium]|nr:ABC transporter ATP-binding protein [Candidatus Komeilibacteria bacterium]
MPKSFTKQTFKIYWQHVRRYSLLGGVIVVSVILASSAHLIVPIFYKHFFDILAGSGEVADKAPLLVDLLVKALAFYLIGWVFWRIGTFGLSYLQNTIMVDLANSTFAYIHKHSINFFNNTFVGSLVKKANRFSRSFEQIFDTLIFEFLPIFVDVVFVTVILAVRNRLLGVIVLVWVAIYLTINYFFSLYKLKYDFQRTEADSRITAVLADSITNHQNIKLFNGYEREKSFFGSVNNRLKKIRIFCWNLGAAFEAVQGILMIFLEIGIFYFAVKMWQRGLVSIGDFVLIQAYLLTIFHRLWNFGRIIRHYYEHLADANEMTEILETPHEIKDVHKAKDLSAVDGTIEFKSVTFNYNQTRRVIDDLNLIIKPKERVALIGPSGAGKSTVVNLLLRNYDLEKGKILIDGQKLSQVTLDSLWQNIALVPQDPILFHRTLMENIKYGRPEATDEEAVGAAGQANAHDFISGFSEGYQTYVGERGIKLSGGERQRVAIARAILKNAPILVMDEATSSLDSESERLIQEALDTLMKDKTVIVIAHRLSTIMKMDRIVVIDQGKVVEEGTHQQLLKQKNGLYKKLWERQAGGFIQ